MRRLHTFIVLLAFLGILTTGCTSSMKPGKMSAVQVDSDKPRAGNVYLLRGWIGVFSHGIDQLTEKLEASGVRARQYQDDQWGSLAATINKQYAGKANVEPLVLIGHSYGADDVVRIARRLEEQNIQVDLLITLDPVTPPSVPKNVKNAYNLYQSNGMWDKLPFLRGVALVKKKDNDNVIRNVDIRKERTDLLQDGTDHFNIEKKPRIHDEVLKQVLTVCPDRATWAAGKVIAPAPTVVAKPVNPSAHPATQPVARSGKGPTTPNGDAR